MTAATSQVVSSFSSIVTRTNFLFYVATMGVASVLLAFVHKDADSSVSLELAGLARIQQR